MISKLFRIMWRLLILALGLFIIYIAVFRAVPYFDARMPLALALLLVYCLLAYLAIPALFRLLRLVIKPDHIPMYVTTGDGWPADPVNMAVIVYSKAHFIETMQAAGWYTADKATLRNSLQEAASIILDRPYPTAPFSNLYLFGRPFDVGFQLPRSKNMSARARHHVRFWQLTPPGDEKHAHHYDFWQQHFKDLLGTDKEVWIGAALDDTGPLGIRWRTGQLTHKNDSNTETECDFIIQSLRSEKLCKPVRSITAGKPFSFRGQTLGNTFICDGTIKVVELKNPLVNKLLHRR